jgi:hypothetical protein
MSNKTSKLLALFCLFAFLLNYPIVGAFSKPHWIMGFPALFVYLFILWFLVIASVWIVQRQDFPSIPNLKKNKKK